MPTIVPFETLTDLFLNLSDKYKNSGKTAFAFKPSTDKEYKSIFWDEVTDDVYNAAAWLVESGIQPGDRVALLSENRYEWAVVDLALQLIGGVNVSIYATLPAEECAYLLQNSGARVLFASTGIQLKKANDVFENCPDLERVVAFDRPRTDDYLKPAYVSLFETRLSEGKNLLSKHEETINSRAQSIQPGDLATLIYTSGTTGEPKGAMLSHKNIVSNVKAAHQYVDIYDTDRCLSFLPVCHALERTAGYYAMLAGGAEIYYAESVNTVAKNLTEARPTLLLSVPRLFEKIYNRVKKNVEEGSKLKRAIFNWAVKVGNKYADGQRGIVSLQKMMADKLVFNELRGRTGGRIRFFISGGAALSKKIIRFFRAAGLPILEGYGLTETSPIISAPRNEEIRAGMVGQILKGITVGIQRLGKNIIICQISGEDYPTHKSSEEGEILCRGGNVMMGYWNDEEATCQVIDEDGWLHTGDIGRFQDGYLQVTDRIKHMIVNAGGKNIYPGPIEDLFKTSQWIEHIIVVGEGEVYMAALIVPDFDMLEDWADKQGLSFQSKKEMIEYEDVQKIFEQEVKEYSGNLASYKKIRDFRLIPDEFTVETGELTPTMKVKRKVVIEQYQSLINEIYSKDKYDRR
ncbi:MAG TPA: long-chain fatty acid--CoA ligase [Balneolaceae bacterium]|nr:long-chain fatty acid--CoA ligase [Balneolaceae bacterium]